MPLYTDNELEKIDEFEDLKKALKKSDKVIRLRISQHEDPHELARIAELRNLQSLNLSLADVSELLPKLGALTDLQSLNLQACGTITRFPESILGLSHLRSLTLQNCSLQELPDEISRLQKLEELRCAQNEIRRIPESIGQLARLKVLSLFFNSIPELPATIGNLQALVWLMLDANEIREIPDTIGNLGNLTTLYLKSNELRTLPASIGQLHKLEDLCLDHNPFETLPDCLNHLPAIETLSIESGKRALFMDWSYPHSTQPPRIDLGEMKLHVSPESPLHTPLLAAIAQAGFTDQETVAKIACAAREAIRIEAVVPENYAQTGNSRLGGFPDLPDPALFPKTEGKHWIFLAQINLADIAPLNSYLPRAGLLSFFVDSLEALNGRVLFSPGDPKSLKLVRHKGGKALTSPDDDYTQRPHRVTFQRYFSLPYNPPGGIGEKEDDEADEKTAEAYRDWQVSVDSVDHHLNGHTFTQHESPQQQAADQLRGKQEEWVPLLKLGWDNKVGFCFGDAGTLTFTLHQEDLRRWDFARVRVSLESS